MCAGTGPGWRPGLKTHVPPIRSAQPPSSVKGDWWMCPLSTRSGWWRSIHAASASSPKERRPSHVRGEPVGGAW